MKTMKALYGSLEQVLRNVRKSYDDFSFKMQDMSLTVIPEKSTEQAVKECIAHSIKEKTEQQDETFSVIIHYVNATARIDAMCAGTMKGKEIVDWVVKNIDRKVASFAIVIKSKKTSNAGAKVYFFTAY